MEWTSINDLRAKFLNFFEEKGHLKLPGFSIIPEDDNSLLLINSGMAPMKKYFTGAVLPPKNRVTTCQKCIRTPDIERVGVTSRHITYFEMLGNFSFGDYFKKEATAWAWQFCTEVLNLPEDRLWVSIYEDDNETFEIWTKDVGVNPTHIVRLGKEDNFWEHGAGPCGPCSELYFDRGEEYSCGSPTCAVGCDCDRYIEFWNLVFTQFESDGNGTYIPLKHPNIDTGMGLERLACIVQGVDNVFLVDTMQKIMQHVCKIAGVEYGKDPKVDSALRIITDHVRSTTVMVADGVMPSNEGRGYVLRRLLRRAARQGRIIGIDSPFLFKVCGTVIEQNKDAYPELLEKSAFIKQLIKVEEENFLKTIDQGFLLLEELVKDIKNGELSGEHAFKLNDTYGFPIDLTKEILAERGITVDERRFDELLREQKERARNARQNAGADAWVSDEVAGLNADPTEFVGYECTACSSKIMAILKGNEKVDCAVVGDKVSLILAKTPFYAQGGGQTADVGVIKTTKSTAKVQAVSKDGAGRYLHKVEVTVGTLSCGDVADAVVNSENRAATARNHTAAHLLQAALRQVLGEHVHQAGQMVNADEVRFDFTHFSAMTGEEITRVERLVNGKILEGVDVTTTEMPVEQAKELGATALFNDKYGDMVRVVNVGDFSLELCGGTHVSNTAKLGLFKIVAENSVAAGVRRVEAITGTGVLKFIGDIEKNIQKCADVLKIADKSELSTVCSQVVAELKEKNKVIDSLNAKIALARTDEILKNAEEVLGTKVLVAKFEDTPADFLKCMCDELKTKLDDFVAVLGSSLREKATIICCVGKKTLERGLNAGKIVKEVAKIAGGNGGGTPEMAMAGIKNVEKLNDCLKSVKNIVKNEYDHNA